MGPGKVDASQGNGEPPSITNIGASSEGTWLERIADVNYLSPLFIGGLVLFVVVVGFYYAIKDRAARGGMSAGGLNYVVGPMGSGKSMFGVRAIIAALREGRYVVTNCRLLDGWAEAVVRKHLRRDWRDPARRARAVAWLEGFYVYETDLRVAMRYRIPCATCGGDARSCGHTGPEQEGRAVIVWDETHNDLNNRDWDGAGDTREARAEDRQRKRLLIRWATQLRKLGFVGYLLSQHHENTDKQLQRVCNNVIRLQNQRNAEGLWLAKMLPRRWTLFLVYWYPAHLATDSGSFGRQPYSRRDRYWLPWERNLYDSWETYHGIDDGSTDETTPILLPAGGRPNLEAARGAPRERGASSPPDPPSAPPLPSPSLHSIPRAPGGSQDLAPGRAVPGVAGSTQALNPSTLTEQRGPRSDTIEAPAGDHATQPRDARVSTG